MAVIPIAKKKAFSGGSWPTAQQELLLRAALQQGMEALDAWETWKKAVPFDQIDPASMRLLPLVYRNMQTQTDLEDPLLQKLKGVYRHTWAMNQLLMQNMAGVVRSFRKSGIATMLLKGAALVTSYYKDYGLRPMNDFDVLVQPQQSMQAIQLLQESGYKLREPMPNESPEVYISLLHGFHFCNDSGNELDLHWHVLSECLRDDSDRDFWSASGPVEFFGVATRVLNPADQLLHVCVHGLIWDPVPPIRWIPDAFFILNCCKSELDWDRVIFQAKSRRLILFLRNALRYLAELRADLVPLETLEELGRSDTSSMERLEYKYKTQNRRNHPLGHLPQIWFNYSRRSDETRLHRKLLGFIKCVAQFFGIHRSWQLPFFLAYMALRRMVLLCFLYQRRLVSVFQRQ